jgi:hypothetical protein
VEVEFYKELADLEECDNICGRSTGLELQELFSIIYFLCLVFTTALEVGEQSGMVTDEGL